MSVPESIAHYRISGKLGKGGMGEVYRAIDTKLRREVAIKVIPALYAEDIDLMARFTREAHVLASLNHPNIAAIHGVEERAIVMELVEGSNLSGPLTEEAALPVIGQIIDALEYAHERRVVHRDLKPANIMVTSEGRVKVLDFGLAKAFRPEPEKGADSDSTLTLTEGLTGTGIIMGTAAYMSPEQARGEAVDQRTDIWAFGVVLYELLTGRRLFARDDRVQTMAAVLLFDPDLTAVPERFQPLLRVCLMRDPRQRLREIGDARHFLREEISSVKAVAVAAAPPRRGFVPWIAAGVAGIAAIAAGVGMWRATRPVERPMLHLSVDMGKEFVISGRGAFAISPDGDRIAYVYRTAAERSALAVRELNQADGTVIPGTEGADQPFFSPGGQWIGFFADGMLKKAAIAGGAAVTTLAEAPIPRGAYWGEDGHILFEPTRTGLMRIHQDGGKVDQITSLGKGEIVHRWPQLLLGGEAVIFSAHSNVVNFDEANIVAFSMKTRERKTLIRGAYYGRYLPGGYLLYVREGKVFGARFDAGRLEVTGQPVTLLNDINPDAGGNGAFDFGKNGLFVYRAGVAKNTYRYPFGWMAEGGKMETVPGVQADLYRRLRLSPDGKRVAMVDRAGAVAIWDFGRAIMYRLTGTSATRGAVWTPDGKHLVFGGAENAIWWQRFDGSGAPVKLLAEPAGLVPSSFSPDGRTLASTSGGPLEPTKIWLAAIDAADPEHPRAGRPELLLTTGNPDEGQPDFSPDGRWLAYASSESGNPEVYVRPFGSGNGKWMVSQGGGTNPKWSRGGKQLFYRTPSGVHVVKLDYSVSGGTFIAGRPRRWSDTAIHMATGSINYDVSPDGKRVLAFEAAGTAEGEENVHMTFLVNFFDEVKRRIP